MLFKIVFVSDEAEDFLREITIDADATFLDLNKAILKACSYTDDQITSFYTCNENWEQKDQVIREDIGDSSSEHDVFLMEKTQLRDLIEEEDDLLVFEFDPLAGRMFFMKVKEIVTSKNQKNASCTKSEGKAPKQLADPDAVLKDVTTKDDALLDEDSNFYGSDGFNEDEFDSEAFEITDN